MNFVVLLKNKNLNAGHHPEDIIYIVMDMRTERSISIWADGSWHRESVVIPQNERQLNIWLRMWEEVARWQ